MTDYRLTTDGKIYEVTDHGERRLPPERERITRERFKAAGVGPGVVAGVMPSPMDEPDPGYGAPRDRLRLVGKVMKAAFEPAPQTAEERDGPDPDYEKPAQTEIRPRDLVVSTSSEQRDSGATVHHVTLSHKPSGVRVEAYGLTYEQARQDADTQLRDQLELRNEEEAAFS